MNREPSSPCREADLILLYYRDLDPATERELQHHLGECAPCRRAFAALERDLDGVPAVETGLSPAETERFTARVLSRTRRRRLVPALGGSAAAAATLLLLLLLHGKPEAPPEKAPPQVTAELEPLPQLELLREMELLEHLELLQEMEKLG